MSRPEVVERRLQLLIDKVYQGQPGLLVVHLLKSHQLHAEHRDEIRRILDQVAEQETEGA